MAPEWEDPGGVRIDAILFGGRRANVVPLVCEAFSWEHGVFQGATMTSETTAAAAGFTGRVRFDPMAMLPFCGYNMGDYFAHWLRIGERCGARVPRVFCVNWFRKGADGRFLWPGFGENMRVLEWVFRRCDDVAPAVRTPVGLLPTQDALNIDGLDIAPEDLRELITVDAEQWRAQLPQLEAHFRAYGDQLPSRLADELRALAQRLGP
jgi:phosphoenolpyruvate carboxykinase (GTP)